MDLMECVDCGSIIRCDFKDCPYCDTHISKGPFWSALASLTGNYALQQSNKSIPASLDAA